MKEARRASHQTYRRQRTSHGGCSMSFFRSGTRLRPSPVVRAVATLSLTQLIGWGATFWLPAVTGSAMAHALDLPLSVIMAGPTIMLVVMAIISWPLGIVLERHGARPVMMSGSLLGAGGLLSLGLADGPAVYVVSWLVLGIAGAGMLTTPAQIALTEIAGERSRQALGVLILAGGLTSTVIWPVAGVLQAEWGWRVTTLVCAALMLCICLPLHGIMLARQPRKEHRVATAAAPPSIDRSRLILMALSFAANGFFTWGFALTIIILFQTKGLDHTSAVTAAAVIGLAQAAGRLVDILGGRHLSSLIMGLVGMALFPLSFGILLLTGSLVGAVLFATVYGLASGITAVTRATLPLQLFPAGAYARATAQMALPLNLAYASAPPAFTAITTTAGPQAALWLALVMSVIAFCTLLNLVRYRLKYQPDQ